MSTQFLSMGDLFHVNIIEEYHISPPPESFIPPITLPLTYFDIPWLFYSPNQTLFFYKKIPPKFITTLKKSLSLALQHFYPLAGNLLIPPPPIEPYIVYTNGDSVSFTIAKTNTNIDNLSGNHPRNVTDLSSLLTQLPSPSIKNDNDDVTLLVLPLLAIQVTVFGDDSGLSIGVTSQHAACDERTLYAFMKLWASYCKSLLNNESLVAFKNSPWFDRNVILDPNNLKTTLLKQWWNKMNSPKNNNSYEETEKDIVQSTFYFSPLDIKTIREYVVGKCKKLKEDPPLNLSLYETGACYTWICLLKLQETKNNNNPVYLGYNASGISRLKYEIPFSYFGCCIVFGRFGELESELLGENGLVCATQSFEIEINRLVRDFLEGGENWIKDWNELNLRIIGSPKVDFYGIDFGVGKAEKIEKISGDKHGRVHVMTMNGGREIMDGGLEIGVVLSKDKMSEFTTLFNNGLVELAKKC
uniref:coumaroyl-CoA:anthocyanidin 3-O-glucoside-6''-O-coumaroyltransferase 2-like n=1 Tax=Erigeron canadensis TaxID=72917 RepID=UPI001CB970B3|nr:coumaroyl-CoA:anthocyanidin 3-O-glucoside-6''-O-coumaroyltransferase 2-like [Erigeron canadensis]